MRQDRDGVWRATVDLEPNRRYHFRYLIDGNWQSDYHADGWAESGYGSENSIVDTSILTDADPAMSGGLARRHPDSANIVEERQSVSSGFAPVIIIGEEHVLHSRRPVRQRTAVVRHTA